MKSISTLILVVRMYLSPCVHSCFAFARVSTLPLFAAAAADVVCCPYPSKRNVEILDVRYREMHHISDEVHKGFLEEQGWTQEEYRAGFQQSKAPRDGSARFLEYEALVARELRKGEVSRQD